LEFLNDLLWSNTNNVLSEDGSIVINTEDFHTIHERFDVQFGEEGGFGLADDLSLLADLNILKNFNLTLLNFCGNVEGMEERNLRWVQTSGSRGNDDILRGDGSNFSGSLHFVFFNKGFKFENRLISENKANFLFNQFT